MKTFFWLLLIALIGAIVWLVFALWTGLYSVYTIPPSREKPDGATLIVNREEGEPLFNSPEYRSPEKKAEPKKGGMSFQTIPKAKKPLKDRTILELPYIDWTYRKSLEPQSVP